MPATLRSVRCDPSRRSARPALRCVACPRPCAAAAAHADRDGDKVFDDLAARLSGTAPRDVLVALRAPASAARVRRDRGARWASSATRHAPAPRRRVHGARDAGAGRGARRARGRRARRGGRGRGPVRRQRARRVRRDPGARGHPRPRRARAWSRRSSTRASTRRCPTCRAAKVIALQGLRRTGAPRPTTTSATAASSPASSPAPARAGPRAAASRRPPRSSASR